MVAFTTLTEAHVLRDHMMPLKRPRGAVDVMNGHT